jgi:hypothetical protein
MASTNIIAAVGDRTGGSASPIMRVAGAVGAIVAAGTVAVNRQTI